MSSYSAEIPAGAELLSGWHASAHALEQSCKEVVHAVRSRATPRSPSESRAEYTTRWERQRRDARWAGADSLAAVVRRSSYGQDDVCAMLDFRAYRLPAPDFFAWRALTLERIFRQHVVDPDTPIVEIGCGLGKNLLILAAAGYTRLTAVDVVPAALDAVRAQFDYFGIEVTTILADALNMDPTQIPPGSTIFTNYVLEQFPDHVAQVLSSVAACEPAHVLHIEPSHEARPGRRAWERIPSLLHARSHDYSSRMATELGSWAGDGRAEVLEVTPLGFSPYLFHSPTLLRWRPLPRP